MNNKQIEKMYCVKTIRLLEYLLAKGYKPYATISDATKHKNWLFTYSEELKFTLNNFF